MGRVRLLVGNRESGRVESGKRFAGSGSRKVTRGQLCVSDILYMMDAHPTSQAVSV